MASLPSFLGSFHRPLTRTSRAAFLAGRSDLSLSARCNSLMVPSEVAVLRRGLTMVPRSPSTSRNSSAALLAAGGVAAALVSVLAADASSRNNSANIGESFNFIADAAESAAPMVVNIIVNVSQRGGRTSPFGGGLGGERTQD